MNLRAMEYKPEIELVQITPKCRIPIKSQEHLSYVLQQLEEKGYIWLSGEKPTSIYYNMPIAYITVGVRNINRCSGKKTCETCSSVHCSAAAWETKEI